MDDYSKTGPRSYAAEAKRLEQERMRLMAEGLALSEEADFITFLRDKLGVKPGDPRYIPAIRFWRDRRL